MSERAYGEKIHREMQRQDRKWGPGCHLSPEHWLRILVEEVGEVAAAMNWHDGPAVLEREIAQVAAVCVHWLGDLERTPEDES